jgi:DNA segregation ATPase FtsK/SpoIIIE, S-DNA-T family
MSTPLPIPSPASMLAPGHKVNSFLDDIGNHVGSFLRSPHIAHVSSLHTHAAMLSVPGMVLPAAGIIAAAPVGVWAWKRRRHLRSSIRGLASPKVWRERRRWHRRISQLEIGGHTAPKTMAAWPTRSGTTMVLKMVDGMNMRLLQKDDFAHAITAHLACMDLAFEPIYTNKGQCYVHVGRRDSLADAFPWPWMDQETTDFFGRIPAGVDTNGKPVMIDLRERNVLVGGGMGSGKSWWLHTLVAAAMADKRVNVHILDGKMGSGFSIWEPSCDSFATNDIDDLERAYQIIRRLEARVNKVYEGFRSVKERTVDWSKVREIDLLVLDEFTAFTGYKDIHKRLSNLLARGRAAGLIMILTTQRPSSKIVDTDFRELFQYRAAFLSDREGSKMILGAGIEADASIFSGLNPGEMWLLHEGRQPVRCRGYSLTDSDLATLAARAQRLRAKDDAPHETVPPVAPVDAPQISPDTPLKPRSPNSGTNLSLVPPVDHSEPHGEPIAPPKTLPKALRPTLVCIALHGPQVSSDVIRTELGVASSTQLARCHRLEALGFVTGARRVSRPGRGSGGRDPMLWSITQAGTAALTHRPATKEGANA